MQGADEAAPYEAINRELPYLSRLSDVKAGVTCDVKAVVRRVFDAEAERLLLKCMSCLSLLAIVLCCVCVCVCLCVCVCVCECEGEGLACSWLDVSWVRRIEL